MGSRYLTDLADVCRRTGRPVVEVDGWQHRARGSGGYDSGRPNHVMLHHTASGSGSDGWPDVNYCTFGDDDAPLCNLYLSRDGTIYVCAAGATNTNGSGSDPCGMTNDDSMNSSAIGIEAGNNGTGETWPDAQLTSYLALSDQLCRAYGIAVHCVHSHREWAPTRKSDPAGPPRYAKGSDTWDMDAYRADVDAFGGDMPSPTPPSSKDGDMLSGIWKRNNGDAVFTVYTNGTKQWVNMDESMLQGARNLAAIGGIDNHTNVCDDPGLFAAMGIIIGPVPPGCDQWGNVP